MSHESHFLTTVQPSGKDGVRMPREVYTAVKEFILSELDQVETLTVTDLISKGVAKFGSGMGELAAWRVYHVKLDLETRGLIRNVKSKQTGKIVITKNPSPGSRKMLREKSIKETNSIQVNQEVKGKFIELFRAMPMIVHSPGRINLIGEHTDYNNGYVLPASIDKGIQIAIAPSRERQCVLYSNRYQQFHSIDLFSDLKPVRDTLWANYFIGILYQLRARGFQIKPFNCVFDGDLPLGAGLSSSAAVECGFAFALNELNNFALSLIDLIHISQRAEHIHAGVKCGIMDQFTSVMGKINHAMLLDCQSLSYKYFPLELKSYALVLCDTKVKHSLASSEYNTRRNECAQGVAIIKTRYPEVESLRDVTPEMLESCERLLGEQIYKRCLYVVEENGRVLAGSEDLIAGRIQSFGKRMFETHSGLSRLYEVSCEELDFLVEEASQFEGVVGARMVGGGFGGCTLNILEQDLVGSFLQQVKQTYKSEFKREMAAYVVRTGSGTALLENPIH